MRGSGLIVGLAVGLIWTIAMAAGAAAATAAVKGGLCKVICAPAPAAQAETKPAPVAKRVAGKPPAAKPAAIRPAPARRAARHRSHHYAERRDYYSYREVARDAEHGSWHQVPNDTMIPPPQAYGPHRYCDCTDRAGLEIDRYGWTGGVGNTAGAEVFVDGYGMVHYGRSLNGPTYNSYGQSFPFNPSRRFQPRVLGGFAPGARR